MVHEDFHQGVSAGTSKAVTKAAKFGEFDGTAQGKGKQLHEFGIVYHPKGPYIIGIMTQGNDFNQQANVIRDIAAFIYKEIDADVIIGGRR